MKLIASFVAMRYIHEKVSFSFEFFQMLKFLQSVLQDIISIVMI
jgi:hypothetical protein